LRQTINEDGLLVAYEWDSSESGNQWFLVFSMDDHLQAFPSSVVRFDGGFVFPCHLGHG
jgi:hypothetical protein